MAVGGGLILSVWLFSGIYLRQGSTFNLDEENVLIKKGDEDSLFGFSLAMHHQLRPTNQQFLLVGAPRAKALPGQRENVTGGLYRCKFTTETNCERISIDTEDVKGDSRENQWLGVSVQSQGKGGRVTVCAHRFQRWSYSNQVVEGKCLILREDLQTDIIKTFCRDRTATKERFGYCQQGLSVAFTKDGEYFVYSAPGAYEWRGTVRMDPISNESLESFETGDQNDIRYHIPLNFNSYLGFALDTGMNLIRKGKNVIVAGAPRSNFSGEVLMLSPDVSRGTNRLMVEHVFSGPGLASSFGYSLVVLDLNSDGWDDLIVGAPQFVKKDTQVNNDDSDNADDKKQVGGAVFVYINRAGGQDWKNIKPEVLYGDKESMFGLSLAGIGDVNHDGYNDFAVGAPYLDGGAVCIFHGSVTGVHKSGQKYFGSKHNVKLFGYSLSGNMDIDGNGYPDLAVGSLSDSVLVYRAKPVVSIEKTLTLTPNKIDFNAKCQEEDCLIIAESCFSYTTYPSTYTPTLNIKYTLEEDGDHSWNNERLIISKNSGFVKLQKPEQKQCVQTQMWLPNYIDNMLTDIPISVSVALSENEPANPAQKTSSLPGLQPALNELQPEKTTAKFSFLNTGCGSDEKCQSNLQLQYSFCNKDPVGEKCTPLVSKHGAALISAGASNAALKITVTNKGGDYAYYTRLFIKYMEALPVTNVDEAEADIYCSLDSNNTMVECELENPLKRDKEVTIYVMFNTNRPFTSTSDINITMNLKTISDQVIPQTVARAKVVVDVHFQFLGQVKPPQLYYEQISKEDNSEVSEEDMDLPMRITSEEETDSLLKYEFRISNIGRPLKSSGTLHIHWPKKNKNGNWILYLLKIIDENNQTIPCTPAEEINPLKDTPLKKVTSREKRQAEPTEESESVAPIASAWFGNQTSYQYLTCSHKLQCVEFKCPLEAVDRTTVVTLLARPWSDTFLQEYSSLHYVDIFLNASLRLDGPSRLLVSQTQVKLQVFPKQKLTLLAKHPWWTAFFSVVLALMLLGLLLCTLTEFGCLRCAMCVEDKKGYNSMAINNKT